MEGLSNQDNKVSPLFGSYTTLLSSLWGAVASYMMFYSLLVTQHPRLLLVELVPLLTVWAALERKRWGRLTMIGLSLTLLGSFVLLVCLSILFHQSFNVIVLSPLLNAYDINVPAIIGLLILAVLTYTWFSSSFVIQEFNKNKRATLSKSQHLIAVVMVTCWGVSILLNSRCVDQSDRGTLGSSRTSSNTRQIAENRSR